MARLGSHPNIVQVFTADETRAGEPYIVMQFYPNADLATIARRRPFPVAEALEIGVRLAGAVETAHNVGILHRDIKPANVLADEFGQPGLTDFGIAGRIATIGQDDSGLSVPWAAPEVVRGGAANVVSDVYSLAATVWQLLVGRSPFADPAGRDNSMDAMTRRVLGMSPPPTGRPDVPRSLESALADGLAKNPADRPQTAAELGRRLQEVERELGLSVTHIVVRRRTDATGTADLTTVTPPPPRPDEHTRLRAPAAVDRLAPPQRTGPGPAGAGQAASRPSVARGPGVAAAQAVNPAQHQPSRPAAPPAAETEIGWKKPEPEPEPEVEPSRPRRMPLVLAGAAAVIAATLVGVLIMTSGSPERDAPPAASATRDIVPLDAGVPGANVPPGVPMITPQRLDDATVRFTWTYSAQLDSDTFAWRTRDGGPNGTTTTATVDVPAPVGSAMCLQVKVVRADGSNATTEWSPAGCSD